MLTTGVDAPTCKNVVLLRVINAMTEFKQIIGRGTRVRDDYGKLWFNILDYTGSATRLFADPEFEGDPSIEIEQTIDEAGEAIDEGTVVTPEAPEEAVETVIEGPPEIFEPPTGERRKFYFDEARPRSPPTSSTSWTRTASSCAWSPLPTTPPTRCAPSMRALMSCAKPGPTKG